ncbi:MAG: hypothetical protein IPL33_04710 [Sphingobacteriales bacterium]|nr:hypothetical protein [Sphingobacteriales bacterium]MCC7223863.1 hypothetical protein [Chitinophagales bacterium]
MSILFWFIWILDAALLGFTLLAKSFRNSFTPRDPTAWFAVLLAVCVLSSAFLRWGARRPAYAWAMVLLPILLLLLWYAIDQWKDGG